MGWTCGVYRGQEGCEQTLLGKPEERRPIEKPRVIKYHNVK
jgi:hypothetical protein